MASNLVSPVPAAWHSRSGYRISFRFPPRLNPRLLWVISGGLSFLAAATFAALQFTSAGWEQLTDPVAGPTQMQMAVATFGLCFVGSFLMSSTAAFSSAGLLGLKVERRRRPERRPLRVEVAVISDRASYTSVSGNLSLGGMFLTTTEAHEVGERLTLWFQLPGQDGQNSVVAEVRWRRGDEAPGVGLLFIDPSRSFKKAIQQFLASPRPR